MVRGLLQPEASGHYDVLSHEQTELEAEDLFNDESRRDWPRVVSDEVRAAVLGEEGVRNAVRAGAGE